MAAARPVLASVDRDCDTARLVRDRGCGLVTPAGDVAPLVEALSTLVADAEQRARLGAAGAG